MKARLIRKPDGTIITELSMWSILVPGRFLRDFFRMKELPKDPEPDKPKEQEQPEDLVKVKIPSKESEEPKPDKKPVRDILGHFVKPIPKVTDPPKPIVPDKRYARKFQ